VLQGEAHWLAKRIEVVDQVVADRLRADAHPIGQLDGEGVGVWEVTDFHRAVGQRASMKVSPSTPA
jgi:hypothetical protein